MLCSLCTLLALGRCIFNTIHCAGLVLDQANAAGMPYVQNGGQNGVQNAKDVGSWKHDFHSHQLAFLTPGICPASAFILKQY